MSRSVQHGGLAIFYPIHGRQLVLRTRGKDCRVLGPVEELEAAAVEARVA